LSGTGCYSPVAVSVKTTPSLVGFEKALETVFHVQVDPSRTVDVTLSQVTRTDRHPRWESFALLFTGGDAVFPQATYPVHHAELGSFTLFLVPVTTDGEGCHYEAVFNRPRP
jgi:hypothetical protein